jgi:hypothetical protein
MSRSISTTNGEPVKKSVSSKPKRRCQSRSASRAAAIGRISFSSRIIKENAFGRQYLRFFAD